MVSKEAASSVTSPTFSKRVLWSVSEPTDWTSAELSQLEKSLFQNYNAHVEMTTVEGMIEIAGLFPTKCVRDVALKARQIRQARDSGSLTIGLPSAAACVPAEKDAWIQQTLKENIGLIERIRDNLRQNRLQENARLYERFRENVSELSDWTDGLGLNLPAMSVRMTRLFDSSNDRASKTVRGATKLSIATESSLLGKPKSGMGLESPAGNPMAKAAASDGLTSSPT
jgi:hypothetical protein